MRKSEDVPGDRTREEEEVRLPPLDPDEPFGGFMDSMIEIDEDPGDDDVAAPASAGPQR